MDIEFNREGGNFKNIEIQGRVEKVRPDIIIHNRRSDDKKFNFLIVECKKANAPREDIQYDQKKIRAFLTDSRYSYSYGLQAIYGGHGVTGTLFYQDEDGPQEMGIDFSVGNL